jgi:hypothetical protein
MPATLGAGAGHNLRARGTAVPTRGPPPLPPVTPQAVALVSGGGDSPLATAGLAVGLLTSAAMLFVSARRVAELEYNDNDWPGGWRPCIACLRGVGGPPPPCAHGSYSPPRAYVAAAAPGPVALLAERACVFPCCARGSSGTCVTAAPASSPAAPPPHPPEPQAPRRGPPPSRSSASLLSACSGRRCSPSCWARPEPSRGQEPGRRPRAAARGALT